MHPGAVALITTTALLIGVLLWVGLLFWHRRRPWSSTSLFAVLLTTGIICRLAYVLLTPIFYAPDEQSHVNYIKYLSENHAFPVQAGRMGESNNEWEYFQPPLYYLTVLPVYHLMNAGFHSETATVIALRLCSFALWLLNLRLGLALLKRLDVRDELLRVSVLAMACLLPTYVFVSSAVNNDNLLTTLATGLICLMTRREPSLRNSLALGVLLGLMLWVKQSAVVFFPAIGLWLLFKAVRRNMTWPVVLRHAGISLGLAVLIYSPWAARNWHIYATFTPEDLSAAAKTWPSAVDGLISAGHNLAKTFWSVSGISNNIGYPFPVFGMSYGLVAMAGLAMGLKQNPQLSAGLWTVPHAPILAALGLALLVNVLLVLRFGYLYGMGQGRHLFPLLYPLALLLGWGLKFIPATNATVHVTGFWITYALTFEAFSWSRFPTS